MKIYCGLCLQANQNPALAWYTKSPVGEYKPVRPGGRFLLEVIAEAVENGEVIFNPFGDAWDPTVVTYINGTALCIGHAESFSGRP